jgi:prepilin-type N-terminal cleavage/methylation domain-containing protein
MNARRRQRGFTLVELMVSLVAGLVIAVAVVGLARAATTTFHEQARISAVEAAARTAAERLRQDLIRTSFMSTGNIHLASVDDPAALQVPFGQRVAHVIGDPTPRYATLANLQGLRIHVGGSTVASGDLPLAGAQGPRSLSSSNGLNPDAIEITGNLTTDDWYEGKWEGTGTCGPRIVMRADADPAVRRLLDTGNPDAAARAAFRPINEDFIVRVVDDHNCQHFVPICHVEADATRMIVDLRPAGDGLAILPAVNTAGAPGADNCGGSEGGNFAISPVHRVRWYIGPNTEPLIESDNAIDAIGNKFNLYREMLDGAGNPLPNREIIAEYAIDLKVGIVVHDPDPTVLPPNHIRVFDMDTDPGGGPIAQWTQAASTTISRGPGPQRVRSVRFRIATRAPIPDRTANLIVPPGAPFLARYCLEGVAPATCKKFARVRTLTSEVALINQARMSY